jgi:3-deoxy-manno-octulosonate cytidylyltransferase (CMP-KDO synthetase)
MDRFIAIIPARYASTRFPGKALAQIEGKPMVQHVYERCREVLEHVYVATDDERIANAVKGFGGRFVMTSPDHPSGTDRCAEAARVLQQTVGFEFVLNVQGDEPYLNPEQLSLLMECFKDQKAEVATLVTPITHHEVLFDPNKVKAVMRSDAAALYFSRQPIPFQRDVLPDDWLKQHAYFLHLGLYGFKKEVLERIVQCSPSKLEQAEKLEQLRWLENGFTIKIAVSDHSSIGVDTPEDLQLLLHHMNKNK